MTRLGQMFEMFHTDLKQWFASATFASLRTASERPAFFLLASLIYSQHARNSESISDVLKAKSALKSLGCLILKLMQTLDVPGFIHRAPAHNAMEGKVDCGHPAWCLSSR